MLSGPDILIVLVVLISTGLGVCRGFVREILSLSGWIGGIYLGMMGYESLAAYLTKYGFSNILIAQVVAFLLLIGLALLVASLLSSAFCLCVRAGFWMGVDRLLGAVFGCLRGLLLITLLTFLLVKTNLLSDSWCEKSYFISYLMNISDSLGNSLQSYFPKLYQWLTTVFNKGMVEAQNEGVLA